MSRAIIFSYLKDRDIFCQIDMSISNMSHFSSIIFQMTILSPFDRIFVLRGVKNEERRTKNEERRTKSSDRETFHSASHDDRR
jgi:hypothetical protein